MEDKKEKENKNEENLKKARCRQGNTEESQVGEDPGIVIEADKRYIVLKQPGIREAEEDIVKHGICYEDDDECQRRDDECYAQCLAARTLPPALQDPFTCKFHIAPIHGPPMISGPEILSWLLSYRRIACGPSVADKRKLVLKRHIDIIDSLFRRHHAKRNALHRLAEERRRLDLR